MYAVNLILLPIRIGAVFSSPLDLVYNTPRLELASFNSGRKPDADRGLSIVYRSLIGLSGKDGLFRARIKACQCISLC